MSDTELGVKAGQILADKYRVIKLLGKGGMGSVWRCEHLTLGSEVALKVIKPKIAKNKNSLARFMREARAAARLRSPHVVQILDHGSDETAEVAFIAMELLEGESLYTRLKRDKTLNPELTARIVTHIGRAMSKAHGAGIVHRDLKPDNVFLVENDDEIVAKVLDFGIAKSTGMALENTGQQSPQTQTGALLGTPYYMSPEQATAQKTIDHRSDLWSLAVITYECLLGHRPYRSDSLGDLVLQICTRDQPVPTQHGDVPAPFDSWFARAQERDPEDRFQSAKEMTAALRQALIGRTSTTGEHTPLATASTQPAGAAALLAAQRAQPLTPLVPTEKGFLQQQQQPAAEQASQHIETDKGFPPIAAAQSVQAQSAAPSTPIEAVPSTLPAIPPTSTGTPSLAAVGVESAQPMTGTGAAPETFEAVSRSAAQPKRNRRLVLGGLGALALLAGGLILSRITDDPSAQETATAASAQQETEQPSANSTQAANITDEPSAQPAPSASASTTAAASSSATAAPPAGRNIRIPRQPQPPPPPQIRVPQPPKPYDPLDIPLQPGQ